MPTRVNKGFFSVDSSVEAEAKLSKKVMLKTDYIVCFIF